MGNLDAPMMIPTAGLVAGLLLVHVGAPIWIASLLFAIGAAIYLAILHVSKDPVRGFSASRFHNVWIALWSVALGLVCGNLSQPFRMENDDFSGCRAAAGRISDISNTTRGDVAQVEVSHLIGNDGKEYRCSNFTARVRVDSDGSLSADIDDVVLFPARFQRIVDSPNSFDNGYAERMERRGILYTVRIDDGDIHVVDHQRTLTGLSRRIRDNIEIFIEHTPLERATQKFLISILLGDRSYLDPQLRQHFADAGIAHILALSGMHVGIIGGIILAILFPMNFFGMYRQRLVIATVLLFGYGFISGMAPSTMRACIMGAATVTAIWLERKNSSWNSLLIALFIILVLNPLSIFDVGLQLSFLCVASIIFFANRLNPVDQHAHNRFYNMMSLLLASIVSTTASWVLVALYFGTLPLMFLPANLLLLPVVPFYLTVSIGVIFANACGLDITLLNATVDLGYDLIVKTVEMLRQISGALEISISPVTVWLWLCAVVLAVVILHHPLKRSLRNRLSLSAVALAMISIVMIPVNADAKAGMIIRNNTSSSVEVGVRIGNREETIRFASGKITARTIAGRKIVVADSRAETNNDLQKIECDYLIISKGYSGTVSEISSTVQADSIFIHQSVRRKKEAILIAEADSLGIPCRGLRTHPHRE